MSHWNDPLRTDESFERALLEAGQSEALPIADERAFQQFARLLTATAGIAAGSSLTGTPPRRPFVVRALHSVALKTLLLGALLGSVATWVWLGSRRPALPLRTEPTASAFMPLRPAITQASGAVTAVASVEPGPAAQQPAAPSGGIHARTAATSVQSTRSKPRPATHVSSTLAAEVAALDAARAAAQRGDSDEALRRIARYHQDFPSSVLSADADAVAIETLSAAGRSAAAARLAEQFLARHPNDPHTAVVRRSLGE